MNLSLQVNRTPFTIVRKKLLGSSSAASLPGPLRNKFLATRLVFFSFPGARDIAAISSLLDKVLGKASKLSWEMPRDLPRCEVTSAMSFLVNRFRRDL